NRGTITRAERNAEEIVGQCRRALGDLLNADPDGVIFGRSMTAVTFDLSRTLSAVLMLDRPGGVVVVGEDQAPISQKHTRIGGVSNDTESPFGGNRFEVQRRRQRGVGWEMLGTS